MLLSYIRLNSETRRALLLRCEGSSGGVEPVACWAGGRGGCCREGGVEELLAKGMLWCWEDLLRSPVGCERRWNRSRSSEAVVVELRADLRCEACRVDVLERSVAVAVHDCGGE